MIKSVIRKKWNKIKLVVTSVKTRYNNFTGYILKDERQYCSTSITALTHIVESATTGLIADSSHHQAICLRSLDVQQVAFFV